METTPPRDIKHTLHLLMEDATARNLLVGKSLTLASFYLISLGRLNMEDQNKRKPK